MATSSPHDIVESGRPRVVILGAGFAGLNAARKLAKKEVDVYIVDRNNYHLFQPLLYQVATAGLDPSDISMPVRAVLGKYKNMRVVMSEARSVDRQNKTVILERGELPYDYLIVATGAETKYFGPDAWQQNSTPLKTVEDALELRRKILTAFEIAEQSDDRNEIREWLTFVIIGAGPTGVEMAGAIREIAAEVMRRDFRSVDPTDTRVVLIDAKPHVLPTYPDELSVKAQQEVESRGVEVLVNSPVDDIGEKSVTVGDETIYSHTVIWAAGVATGSLMNTLDTDLDRMGRARIDANLTLPNDPHVFVVGDAANFTHDLDEALPGLAPVAIQMGKHAAKNILRHVRGDAYEPFRYFDKGQMSTIGRAAAVVDFGKIKAVGFFAWVLWLFVHLMYLVGFKNRVVVLIEWAYSYLAFKRGSRIIIGEPDEPHAIDNLALPDAEHERQRSAAQ